jgi:hypothetical protein
VKHQCFPSPNNPQSHSWAELLAVPKLGDERTMRGMTPWASDEVDKCIAVLLEFRVPRVLDEDGILEIHPIVLPALTPDGRGLDDNAVCHQSHPFPWQAGVDDRRKRNERYLAANPLQP